jgi:SAM-dependent methyltransferase
MSILTRIKSIIFEKYKGMRYRDEIKILRNMNEEFQKDVRVFLEREGFLKNNVSIDELSSRWGGDSQKKLKEVGATYEFYKKWDGMLGAINIATNYSDQLRRPYVLSSMMKYIGKNFDGCVLDYGCGTASLSLSYQRKFSPKMRLVLSDVKNLPQKFVKFYASKNKKYDIKVCGIDIKEIPDNSLDVIICIDVLEHLKNPSEVFFLLNKKLKRNGILFLKAPWLGHPEHLEESPVDWNNNAGRKLLRDKYKILYRFNPFRSPSGVFRKLS